MRRSAYEIGLQVLMVPEPYGGLLVAIPAEGGTIVTSLDAGGSSRPGWPIRVAGGSPCGLLLAVEDGSVRLVCQFPGEQVAEGPPPERAYAFDDFGLLLPGWPVIMPCCFTGRMVGTNLVMDVKEVLGTESQPGLPIPGNAWISTVNRHGTVQHGTQVPLGLNCCSQTGAIGPDGIAYEVVNEFGEAPEAPKTSSLTALGPHGVVSGFPISIDGLASGPAFDAAHRIHLTVESEVGGSARVLVFDAAGRSIAGGSDFLGLEASADCVGIEGTCEVPAPPLVGPDGTRYVISSGLLSTVVAGIDPAGQVMAGWPYEVSSGHQQRGICPEGAACEGYGLSAPAIGPGNVLYLLHSAASASTGGRIVAIGPDGKVRPGWPVALSRSGSGFWSVVVGANGTAYALAVEPEAGSVASATILALGADASRRYATTIIDP